MNADDMMIYHGTGGNLAFTSNGKRLSRVQISGGDTLLLQDDLECIHGLQLGNACGLDTGGHDIKAGIFRIEGSTGLFDIEGSEIVITGYDGLFGTSDCFHVQRSSGITANSLVAFVHSGSQPKTMWTAGNFTLNDVHVATGGAGVLNIGGFNRTLNELMIEPGCEVAFENVTTVSAFTAVGGAGTLIKLRSMAPGTQWTLSKASGAVVCDYLDIQDGIATGGATFEPGDNSIDSGNNVGWWPVTTILAAASIAEAGDSASSAARLPLRAAATVVEGGNTLSSASALALAAALSVTHGDDAISAAASAPASGTAGLTEVADAMAAEGELPVAAVAAMDEQGDLLAAQSVIVATGTGAAIMAEAANVLSATAGLAIAGAGTLTEAADAISSAGALPIRAEFPGVEAGDISDAAARLDRYAAADVVAAGDGLLSSGRLIATGSTVIAEAGDAISAAGGLGITALVSATEAGDASASTALVQVPITAIAFVTEAADTVSAVSDVTMPDDWFTRVLLSRESGEAIIVLITIMHPSLPEPVRLCLNQPGKDITSNGEVFKATFFDVRLVSDTEEQPSARLTVANVNREVGALIDGLDDAPTITIDIVLASNPDRIEKSFPQLLLRRASWDASMAEGDLGVEDYDNTPWPGMAVTPALFPAMFK